MFGRFNKKKEYPVHHEDHIVHNFGWFSSRTDAINETQEKIQKVLNAVNVNSISYNDRHQFVIHEFKKENITLILGNFRGLALVKKFAHPNSPMQDKDNFTWELMWLSYGFDYQESTTYKWYIKDLPKVMTNMVFQDIAAITQEALKIIGDVDIKFKNNLVD